MPHRGQKSQVLLRRLRDTMAEARQGQERLDRIVRLIAASMLTEVCSIYLRVDANTMELVATEGLAQDAVHQTRMRVGQGLVGQIAQTARFVSAENAATAPGFRYMPETGEERFSSFLGVPIQRLGEVLGVLVVQTRAPRRFTADDIYGLEIVAMVLAEMTELGAFTEGGAPLAHRQAVFYRGQVGQEGVAMGQVLLHTPQILVANPVADDVDVERQRLDDAFSALSGEIDALLASRAVARRGEHREILETYAMIARDKGWRARMEDSIDLGLAAEVAVEQEQSATRARMGRIADPYLKDRLHDIDDLANRLLRLLSGQPTRGRAAAGSVLVARNIGPGELLDYGRGLAGVVLDEGSLGSHAAVVARALAIPLVVQARGIAREALDGDPVLVDGDQGVVHLRPDESVTRAFREKLAMVRQAREAYAHLRDTPCVTADGARVELMMNAGLTQDLPNLVPSGAEGVGLYRTELQFLARARVPKRGQQADHYRRVMDAAQGKPVTFRTLDIGSDKVLPYVRREDEPNPALGWRAIRLSLERRGVMRMQLQALLRGAAGRPLRVMFPFVAQASEFVAARERLLDEVEKERALGHEVPARLEIGAMLETPSLAYAPDSFYRLADFISVGGNDLKQFFFAADRENERVRRRYDTLDPGYLAFLRQIVARCAAAETPLSFCGEDAGRPVEAACLAAIGVRCLSMRPASIGPVKSLLMRLDLGALSGLLDRTNGSDSVRPAVLDHLNGLG